MPWAAFWRSTTSTKEKATKLSRSFGDDPRGGTDPVVGFWRWGWLAVHPRRTQDDKGQPLPADADDYDQIDWDTDATEELLKEIQPYLEEPLVIQCIGQEKLRYPLAAMEIVVPPKSGEILFFQFDGEYRLKPEKRTINEGEVA